MNKPVYCIRDVKVGFLNPVLEVNEETAKRNFAYAINNLEIYSFAPKDFDLYYLGEFDIESGCFIMDGSPQFVIAGTALVGV